MSRTEGVEPYACGINSSLCIAWLRAVAKLTRQRRPVLRNANRTCVGLAALIRATGGSKERIAESQWWSLCVLLFVVTDDEKKWR